MMDKKLLLSPLSPWQERSGPFQDIVIDSRVRLNRNLKKYVFPDKASESELAAVLEESKRYLGTLDTLGEGHYTFAQLTDFSPLEREMLVVKHFSSAGHIEQPKDRGLIVREDGAVSILVNELDHLVIQSAAHGFNLEQAFVAANNVDDALESHLDFAFRDDFGYLTASPSLTGTGLTLGVTLHIPALVLMKRLNRIVQGVTKFGFVVSGLYGQRDQWLGDIFQITNQVTLGVSEKDLCDQLSKLITQIVHEEENCRLLLWKQNQDQLKDKWLRTYGILQNAWLLDDEEPLSLIGYLRYGIDMDVIPADPLVYEALLNVVEPAYLQLKTGSELSGEELQHARAEAVQEVLRTHAK